MILSCLCSVAATAALEDFERCSIGEQSVQIDGDCRYVTVPVDPDDPLKGDLRLFVSRLPAGSPRTDSAADPLLLIAGGPGQAASEAFPAVLQAFHHVRRHRDLILIDQRGTGRSHPLDCPAGDSDPLLEPEPEAIAQQAAHCVDALKVDARLFTTSVAVRDLEQVRKALAIERWNLYGVSYGSRVALHYLRRYPSAVRSVILDAVLPPGVVLGPTIAVHAQAALDAIFTRCEQDPGCARAFPTIAADTRTLFRHLQQNPRTVTFEDFAGGSSRTLEFTDRHLAVTLRLLSYSAYGAAILPSMLAEAIYRQNYAPLARQALLQTAQLENTLSVGMHNAVVCTEDAPFIGESAARKALDSTYLGPDLLTTLTAICAAWPAGRRDADFRQPVQVSVPTLLLSGGADPVTPPAYGDMVAASLGSALHIVNPGQGHMQAPLGCMPRIIGSFVARADVASLPLECLERLLPPAFFIDANGPRP